MESHFKIEKSDDTLFVEISVKPKFYAYLLFMMTFLALTIPFLVLDFKIIDIDMIFTIIVFTTIMILFPLKYTLWNILGKENLIINTKSISYQYNYGFISNNLQSVTYNKLSVRFGEILTAKEKTCGKVYFYNEDEYTGLNKLIHHTSVFVTDDQYNLLAKEIFELGNHRYHLN